MDIKGIEKKKNRYQTNTGQTSNEYETYMHNPQYTCFEC